MIARPPLFRLLACAALLLGAGCGGNDAPSLGTETDEPAYQQGKQLQKQGRNPEALAAFLKVIERRGEQNAPESHFEVGYLLQKQDPIEAIHHFRKYLELRPTSKEAPLVRGLIDSAKREFLRTLPGRPDEGQTLTADLRELERLRRENDLLKVELASLRGQPVGGPMRVTFSTVDPAGGARAVAPAPADEPPFALAPSPAAAPPQKSPPAAKPAVPAGRRHTVSPGETLYSISRRYGVKPEAIAAANPLLLPTVNAKLSVGVELKIP
jgi:LysM repeat protein